MAISSSSHIMDVSPHAVLFPHPVQGHINPMLHLASHLLTHDFVITFVNTTHNHARIFENASSQALLSVPNLHFVQISDGLPPHHGRINQDLEEFIRAIDSLQHGPFHRLMEIIADNPMLPPVTCIIADSYLSWVQDVANSFQIPRISFWTTPAHASLTFLYQSDLLSKGIIPYKGIEDRDPDLVVRSIPGVQPLRVSDLNAIFEEDNFVFRFVLNECMQRNSEALWNVGNNFYELEVKAMEALTQHVSSFLPVGPMLPPGFFDKDPSKPFYISMSLWHEDAQLCDQWLAKQRPRSVVYVAFGSVATLSHCQLTELAEGLKASEQPFLWAVRTDPSHQQVFQNLWEHTKDRGFIIPWVPQLQVLSHPAVGAFLTHCGWNSILESISAGVPLLAWPGRFAEQKMNGRYIVDEWKVGTEFKTQTGGELIVDRLEVERVIRAFMVKGNIEAEAIRNVVQEFREKAKKTLMKGGSSHNNLQRFVDDMKRRATRSYTSS